MLLLSVALAFDTADPYDRLRAFPNAVDDGPVDVAPFAYRRGQPEEGRAAPRLQIERDTGWTDLADPYEVVDAGSFGFVRFDAVCADEPNAHYRITWGLEWDDRSTVEFDVSARVEAVEPPALLAATAFEWQPAWDTGEVHTFCGIDFQFEGEEPADSYWEWTNPELNAAGWVLFAIAASGETVFMEADRTYIANYNAMVEPNQHYAFDVYWVSPQGEWLAAGHVEGETEDCESVELPVDEIDETADSGMPTGAEPPGGEPATSDCEADRGCGAATAASLGILLMSATRRRESPPSHPRPGTGPGDSP